MDEGPTGEGTPRSQRQGGPKRYEPRRKPRGKRSANRESRGRLVGARNLEIGRGQTAGKSTRQGKTEPTAWGERKRETGWTQAKAGVDKSSDEVSGDRDGVESLETGKRRVWQECWKGA